MNGSWGISGYVPGAGRRPLNSRMFAGQFNSNLRGVNIFGFGGPSVTVNNYGDYGCYDDGMNMPKWMQWTMFGGMGLSFLGNIFGAIFGGGGGGGKTEGAGGKQTATDSQKEDIAQYRSAYKDNCTISDPLNNGKVIITGKEKVNGKYPRYTVDVKDLGAKLSELYDAQDEASGKPTASGSTTATPGNDATAAASGTTSTATPVTTDDGTPKTKEDFNKKWGANASVENAADGNGFILKYNDKNGVQQEVQVKDLKEAEAKLKEAGIEPPNANGQTTASEGASSVTNTGNQPGSAVTISIPPGKNTGITYAIQRELGDKANNISVAQWQNVINILNKAQNENKLDGSAKDYQHTINNGTIGKTKGNIYGNYQVKPGDTIKIPAEVWAEIKTALGITD